MLSLSAMDVGSLVWADPCLKALLAVYMPSTSRAMTENLGRSLGS